MKLSDWEDIPEEDKERLLETNKMYQQEPEELKGVTLRPLPDEITDNNLDDEE